MIRKIVDVKNPLLREKSRQVTKFDKKLKELIIDLKDTLAAQDDPEGVGLAAPQIGKPVAVFLMRHEGTERVVINPQIVSQSLLAEKKSKNKKVLEGCLSLPHYYGPLTRSTKISITYSDEFGKQHEESFSGFLAQIVQHELDHLNGILFVDRILEQNAPLYHFHGDEWEEVELI